MTRSLVRHLDVHLLALVMSGVMLVPNVIHAYDITRNDNLAVYWGQGDGNGQQDMSTYCQDDTIDNIIIAFLDNFGTIDGELQLNLANTCSSSSEASEKRQMADCSFMSSQIKQCQDKGKIVTLSLGGAISQVGFSTNSQARTFADNIWNMFLSGSGQQRPFGDAILDGVDLDIEQGIPTGYAAFVNRLRERAKSGTNKLYVTAAPQCPFPDAHIGQALNDAPFDAVYVQFYNNYCGVADSEAFNFDTWDQWAKHRSANPDIKVYIGALAGYDGSGYVDSNALAGYITHAQSTWSSFGGVMLWEASLAVANNNYHQAVKNSLLQGGTASDPPSRNRTASTSLQTPGASPTSPYADGPKWHRRSRFRNRSRATKHSH